MLGDPNLDGLPSKTSFYTFLSQNSCSPAFLNPTGVLRNHTTGGLKPFCENLFEPQTIMSLAYTESKHSRCLDCLKHGFTFLSNTLRSLGSLRELNLERAFTV